MPKRTDIKRILIIGAGPIVIGQACEFDYSGSQACRALMHEGYEVVLVNSNPATIMTDPNLATRTYIEPLTVEVLTKIIDTERPDALLPTMGGQTALNLAFALKDQGVLARYNVTLIGANESAIHTAEDRSAFKHLVEDLGLGVLRSEVAGSVDEARSIAADLGYPLILRTAFTLGGSGGGVVFDERELEAAASHALAQSPIKQVLMEESALGWKEYEFEVMRDGRDNVVIVCSVENLDPMGIHTGDSITVAPAMTLSDREYHVLRNASIDIIRAVGVDAGGCNIQFAIHPQTGRVVVIEMNPRVSRSSALVSKATGVPIAKISAKLAVGMTLDEIENDITRSTPASFEPAIDYVVTKIPRFAFEKFAGSPDTLSPQMKSVGEAMAIGRTFQESFQKALQSLETGLEGFHFPACKLSRQELEAKLKHPSSDRVRWVYHALQENWSTDELYTLTGIDPWFINNMRDLVETERALWHCPLSKLDDELLRKAKRQGFSQAHILKLLAPAPDLDKQLARRMAELGIAPVFNAVDTCAGEFAASTPYYYSTFASSLQEAPIFESTGGPASSDRVVIIGGGPNRIGQGIEFDYCCVHAAFSLQQAGLKAVMVNSNPETVSTDYDISDRLYFEPLSPERILNILAQEQPRGVVVQLGGQTPLKLAKHIHDAGYPLLGTSLDSIDEAEDRQRFSAVLKELGLKAPASGTARSADEAFAVARQVGYPLIVRPSYILGGRAMRVLYSEASLRDYVTEVVRVEPDYPILIERFLEEAMELDVDAVSDGTDTYIGGILEHIEHAGIHSGDSTSLWPPQRLPQALHDQVVQATEQLARRLNVRGLLNIQFAVKDGALYVIEVNPRASRTVPFICKCTGVPLVKMATEIMLGRSLADVAHLVPVLPSNYVAVKGPVFPFNKFRGADPKLGPEMKSTGEVMGLDKTAALAFAKAQVSAGSTIPMSGNVFISVNDFDKPHAVDIARQLVDLGFSLVSTTGTAQVLQQAGLAVTVINKKSEGRPHAESMIEEGAVQLVINTPIGEGALQDDSYIRKAAVAHAVPMMTTMAGAQAMLEAIVELRNHDFDVTSLQDYLGLSGRAVVTA
ncbi:MAG: carbamoyl-phosphate synthase large subunit [Cyanobacteria bacterium HKST-UBA04]|nr:carbamoyl-phosphate synthase large subunit [Cyanobacteria bacterium HKST-UBA04]